MKELQKSRGPKRKKQKHGGFNIVVVQILVKFTPGEIHQFKIYASVKFTGGECKINPIIYIFFSGNL